MGGVSEREEEVPADGVVGACSRSLVWVLLSVVLLGFTPAGVHSAGGEARGGAFQAAFDVLQSLPLLVLPLVLLVQILAALTSNNLLHPNHTLMLKMFKYFNLPDSRQREALGLVVDADLF